MEQRLDFRKGRLGHAFAVCIGSKGAPPMNFHEGFAIGQNLPQTFGKTHLAIIIEALLVLAHHGHAIELLVADSATLHGALMAGGEGKKRGFEGEELGAVSSGGFGEKGQGLLVLEIAPQILEFPEETFLAATHKSTTGEFGDFAQKGMAFDLGRSDEEGGLDRAQEQGVKPAQMIGH